MTQDPAVEKHSVSPQMLLRCGQGAAESRMPRTKRVKSWEPKPARLQRPSAGKQRNQASRGIRLGKLCCPADDARQLQSRETRSNVTQYGNVEECRARRIPHTAPRRSPKMGSPGSHHPAVKGLACGFLQSAKFGVCVVELSDAGSISLDSLQSIFCAYLGWRRRAGIV